jgi:hypothetical protein
MAAKTEPLATPGAAQPDARSRLVCDQDVSVQSPSLARGDEEAVRSPALALQGRLVSEYHEPVTKPWPVALRLAVLVGGTGALWTIGLGLARFVFR